MIRAIGGRILQQNAEEFPVEKSDLLAGADDAFDARCALARVCTTAMVCGWQSSATKNARRGLPSAMCRHIVIASAAAVASSSSDALASGRPVRSLTIVWKFSSASSRPWAISA